MENLFKNVKSINVFRDASIYELTDEMKTKINEIAKDKEMLIWFSRYKELEQTKAYVEVLNFDFMTIELLRDNLERYVQNVERTVYNQCLNIISKTTQNSEIDF